MTWKYGFDALALTEATSRKKQKSEMLNNRIMQLVKAGEERSNIAERLGVSASYISSVVKRNQGK